jgi:hypothetical protein
MPSIHTSRQSHSSKVVTTLLQEGGEAAIEEFVRDWRRHFLQVT